MAYPDDILLPPDALNYGFIDTKYSYNSHWDITWSIKFSVSACEFGFSTFLTTYNELSSTIENSKPGQFLRYYDSNDSAIGTLVIAFDKTGLFALPIGGNPGVNQSDTHQYAVIVRDTSNSVLLNVPISSFGIIEPTSNEMLGCSSFFGETWGISPPQILRFRLSNGGNKLSIDHKFENSSDFTTLTSIVVNFDVTTYPKLYPGFTYCSPISSESVIYPINLFNFHTQGNTSRATYEDIPYVSLDEPSIKKYTIIQGVTAIPYTPPE